MSVPIAANPFATDKVGLKSWTFRAWRVTKLGEKNERHTLIGSCSVNAEHAHGARAKAMVRLHCEPFELQLTGSGPPCPHDTATRSGCRYATKCNSRRCKHVDTCGACGAERVNGQEWDQ